MTQFDLQLSVTDHALGRYGIHHPDAGRPEVRQAIGGGLPINTERVRAILNRPYTQKTDHYVLSPDRRGVFVIAHDTIVVTYLRLDPINHRIVRYWYPPSNGKEA